jgi:hypothetical protein
MKCARFLQSTSRLSTSSVGPFTTVQVLLHLMHFKAKLIKLKEAHGAMFRHQMGL